MSLITDAAEVWAKAQPGWLVFIRWSGHSLILNPREKSAIIDHVLAELAKHEKWGQECSVSWITESIRDRAYSRFPTKNIDAENLLTELGFTIEPGKRRSTHQVSI